MVVALGKMGRTLRNGSLVLKKGLTQKKRVTLGKKSILGAHNWVIWVSKESHVEIWITLRTNSMQNMQKRWPFEIVGRTVEQKESN